jgi:sulfide:quinone oxidoreductase
MAPADRFPLSVLIAGGGVAALEAAFALRELASDRVEATMLAPEPEFVYRPMAVEDPFAHASARRYPMDEIARDADVELRLDALKWLDLPNREVHTEKGHKLSYDALLLAIGAKAQPAYDHVLTLDDRRLDVQLQGLMHDVETGSSRRLAFLMPSAIAWPLPLYELALMTARHARDRNLELSVTLVTPEEAPLAVLGDEISQAVQQLLSTGGVETITSAHSETPAAGEVVIHPCSRRLSVDRAVALPQLRGVPARGVPTSAPYGFIPVDAHCRVRGFHRVYAAGDATDFPVKFGGIAAQQADTAAQAIAATTGAGVQPKPFDPVIHALMLGGDHPLYLSARLTGGRGARSQVRDTAAWWPATKIVAPYLSSYLESRDHPAMH